MDINEQILEELRTIRKLLTVLSQDKLDTFNATIKDKYLKSQQRQQMYDMFDGTKSLKEIAELVGVSSEAVRQFALQLEQAKIIEQVNINGRQKNPKRIF